MSANLPVTTTVNRSEPKAAGLAGQCKLAVVWIDWYAYHLARFRALVESPAFNGRVAGIEIVGGAGVHGRLSFREEQRRGLSITTLFPNSDWQDLSQLTAAMALWRELDRVNPEAVLVPGYYTLPGMACALWARRRNRRSILMSETTEEDHRRRPVKEAAKSALLKLLFDSAIVGGIRHSRYLEKLGFGASRIFRNYDIVDNQFYSEGVRKALTGRRTRTEPYFLYVGRLSVEKNIASLLDEYSTYLRAGGTWLLVVAGDGPMRDSLQQHAAELGIQDKVEFCGMKSANELLPYYAFAGCFVLPSTREPWGLVVNEAMASGLPVIVSGRCGCADNLVQQGVNGYVFDPAEPGALAGYLKQVSSLPGRQRLAMSSASREIIANYSPDLWAAEVVKSAA